MLLMTSIAGQLKNDSNRKPTEWKAAKIWLLNSRLQTLVSRDRFPPFLSVVRITGGKKTQHYSHFQLKRAVILIRVH